MKYNYSFKSNKENIVKVVGRDLGISSKQAIEICSFIKNRPIAKARAILESVIEKKMPVPFNRFTEGAGHKKGMAGGKYPVTASKAFLRLLKTLEANAQNKGLSSELKIIHACAQKASTPLRYGRKRRISMKRSHVEIAAEGVEHVKKDDKAKAKAKAKDKPKAEPKAEAKPETKPEVKKDDPEKAKKPEDKKQEAKPK